MARQQKRRKLARRVIIGVVFVGVLFGSIYLATRKSSTKETSQEIANAVAVKAGCPSSTATRVNTLKFTTPPITINTSANYTASVHTTVGTFVVSLNAREAPKSVNSFIFLAKKGYFHCVIFHRVIPGFVDQTGDPTGTGTGGPGYKFTEPGPPVASPQYPLGSVAMANSNSPATSDPTTNGSQWFVVAGPQGETLPPDYTLFGQVTSGMSVVDKINKDGSTTGVPPKVTQRILSVTIRSS